MWLSNFTFVSTFSCKNLHLKLLKLLFVLILSFAVSDRYLGFCFFQGFPNMNSLIPHKKCFLILFGLVWMTSWSMPTQLDSSRKWFFTKFAKEAFTCFEAIFTSVWHFGIRWTNCCLQTFVSNLITTLHSLNVITFV